MAPQQQTHVCLEMAASFRHHRVLLPQPDSQQSKPMGSHCNTLCMLQGVNIGRTDAAPRISLLQRGISMCLVQAWERFIILRWCEQHQGRSNEGLCTATGRAADALSSYNSQPYTLCKQATLGTSCKAPVCSIKVTSGRCCL